MPTNNPKLTIRQAMEITGFCYQHIWNCVKSGRLKAERQGNTWRIDRSEIDKMIAERDGRK